MKRNRSAPGAQLKIDRDKPFSNIVDLVELYEEIASGKDAQITVFESDGGPLSKQFWLEGGNLKGETAVSLRRGHALRVPIPNLKVFSQLLGRLGSHQAIAYGTFKGPNQARVVTQKDLAKARRSDPDRHVIARDKTHLRWAAGRRGIVMFDIDLSEGDEITPEGFDQLMCGILPWWAAIERLYRYSASSGICRSSDDKVLRPLRNFRVYIHISAASATPLIGSAVYQALWAAGHGRIQVSASGVPLDRSYIDAAVWTPERLDFVGGAHLAVGLYQQRPKPRLMPGKSVLVVSKHLEDVKSLRAWRESDPLLKEKRNHPDIRAECKRVRDKRIDERVAEDKDAGIDPDESRRRWTRAYENHVLAPEFTIELAGGSTVCVSDVLADRRKFHGVRCRDPLEPDYRDDHRIGYINTRAGRPHIWSHAHGGLRYDLCRNKEIIPWDAGDVPAIAREVLKCLDEDGDIFRAHGEVRFLAQESLVEASPILMCDRAEQRFVFEWSDQKKKSAEPFELEDRFGRRMLAVAKTEGFFPELTGISRLPIMRADGTICAVPGYDPASGMYIIAPEEGFPEIPADPTSADLRGFVETIWHAVRHFPYATARDEVTMFVAIITSVMRATLDTAPGILIDASVAGAGKSKLASILALATGGSAETAGWDADEAERHKVFNAVILDGKAVVVFDNVKTAVGGATLERTLTSKEYTGRVLGKSQMFSASCKTLIVFTGNNLRGDGDMWRRLVRVRLEIETPIGREFDFEPVAEFSAMLPDVHAAVLGLVSAYIKAGTPMARGGWTPMESFEKWDRLCLQPVAWLHQRGLLEAMERVGGASWGDVDPRGYVSDAFVEADDREDAQVILEGLHEAFGDRPFKTREIFSTDFDPKKAKVRDELKALGRQNSREAGIYIASLVGTPYGEYVLEKRPVQGNVKRYAVVERGDKKVKKRA